MHDVDLGAFVIGVTVGIHTFGSVPGEYQGWDDDAHHYGDGQVGGDGDPRNQYQHKSVRFRNLARRVEYRYFYSR